MVQLDANFEIAYEGTEQAVRVEKHDVAGLFGLFNFIVVFFDEALDEVGHGRQSLGYHFSGLGCLRLVCAFGLNDGEQSWDEVGVVFSLSQGLELHQELRKAEEPSISYPWMWILHTSGSGFDGAVDVGFEFVFASLSNEAIGDVTSLPNLPVLLGKALTNQGFKCIKGELFLHL